MARRSPFDLVGIVERMAKLSPPRHRDLVRGMVSELDAIDDPAERRRFALGAMFAIVRLALIRGGSSMSTLATRKLLRRHVTPFVLSFGAVTGLLLAKHALRRMPQMSARGASTGTIVEVLLLGVPHVVALTVPMAVFVAVLWVFTRLGREGVAAAARRERHGVRRLLVPVIGVATIVGALMFVSNTQVVPRTNARLAAVLIGAPRTPGEREMTLGELREAARIARNDDGPRGAARAAAYEVEIHKKFALSAACVILALAGAAIGLTFPRRGMGFVLGASAVVFTGYYFSLVAGESLADRQSIPPSAAMWLANALLVVVVVLLRWWPGGRDQAGGEESLAIGA